MGSNIYLNTKNHERAIKAGLKINTFVNDLVERELDKREQEDHGVE